MSEYFFILLRQFISCFNFIMLEIFIRYWKGYTMLRINSMPQTISFKGIYSDNLGEKDNFKKILMEEAGRGRDPEVITKNFMELRNYLKDNAENRLKSEKGTLDLYISPSTYREGEYTKSSVLIDAKDGKSRTFERTFMDVAELCGSFDPIKEKVDKFLDSFDESIKKRSQDNNKERELSARIDSLVEGIQPIKSEPRVEPAKNLSGNEPAARTSEKPKRPQLFTGLFGRTGK